MLLTTLASALVLASPATPGVGLGTPVAVVEQGRITVRATVTCEKGLRARTFLSLTIDTGPGAGFTGVRSACTGRAVPVSREVPTGPPLGLESSAVRRVWVCARSLVGPPGERAPLAAAQRCAPVRLHPGRVAPHPVHDAIVEVSATGARRVLVQPAFACRSGVTLFATLSLTQASGANGVRGIYLRCRSTGLVRPRIPIRVRADGPALNAGQPVVLCITARMVERRGRRGVTVGAGAACGIQRLTS